MGTDQWLQYERYFKISDFIMTVILMQKNEEAETGGLYLFQNKRNFKLSDFNIRRVGCIYVRS